MKSIQIIELVFYRFLVSIKSESSKTYLSFLWWIIDPILMAATYYVLFGILLEQSIQDFVPYLLIGLVVWQWFGHSVTHCGNSINAAGGILTTFKVPASFLVFSTLLTDAFKFSIVFFLLIIFLLTYGFEINVNYLYLFMLVFLQAILNTAFGLLNAAIVPFLPDLQFVIGNALRLVMYMSGIMYSVERIPTEYLAYFYLNPMAVIIDCYRDVLMYNRAPEYQHLVYLLLFSASVLVFSFIVLKRYEYVYPRVLSQR